jgi:hypothetical protein
MSEKLMIIWASIIVLIMAVLLMTANNLRDDVLFKLEKDLKVAANKYVKEKEKLSIGETTIIFPDTLLEQKYLSDKEVLKKYCIESIVLTKGLIINEIEINKNCEMIENEEEQEETPIENESEQKEEIEIEKE